MSASPSTSSRKRSKWKDDDADDASEQSPAPPKQRAKSTTDNSATSSRITPPLLIAPVVPTMARTTAPARSNYVPLRSKHPPLIPSRSVYSYERLNQIEEGSYGVVFRARDKQTGDIVALKKLKLDEEKHGFPITALREINALMSCRHDNVVRIREVVVGETLTQCVQPCVPISQSD